MSTATTQTVHAWMRQQEGRDVPTRTWAQVDSDLANLGTWAVDNAEHAIELAERAFKGTEIKATALRDGADAQRIAMIDARLEELRTELLGMDRNVRQLLAAKVAAYARDLLGECDIAISATATDGITTVYAVGVA